MKTLLHFREFVNEINESNSRLHKQAVLKKYKDDEIVKKYLQINFNIYKVYGISSKKLSKEVSVGETRCPLTVFDLFDYLEVHNTGRDIDIAICQLALDWLTFDAPELRELLTQLICKDLVLGVDRKTINKEIPNCLPEFNLMLANKYFDKPEIVEGCEFAVTTKIDGGRIIAIKENGQVSFYTRAGQKYEGLVELEKEMLEAFPDGVCLDGEITLFNNKGIPSKLAYKETMKITRSGGPKTGVKMLVFDAMYASDFKAQKCDRPWSERRERLESLFSRVNPTYFELLPVLYRGTDTSMITKLLNEAIANQEEGVMINLVDKPYEFKRTNALLKVKKFNSLDLEVVGIEEGSGRLAGTLGAIQVRYKDGNLVKVGSGFSDEERKLYFSNPDLVIGRVVEIKYFEESSSGEGVGKTYSLRFPTWCSNIRTDKLTPDY